MIDYLFEKKKISSPIFISEISANHNGKIENAKKLIYQAKKFGSDYVKLQTYRPDTVTLNSKRKEFFLKSGEWQGKRLWDLYQKTHTPYEWHKELFEYSKKVKVKCISSPFDETAVELLEKLNCSVYKVASFEITHFPLLHEIALTKKPVILSTGMASLREISEAINYLKKNGTKKIVILYCVTSYPAKESEFDLSNIRFLKKHFRLPVGLSDHSVGNNIAKISVAMGSQVFEKHVALDGIKAADYNFSLKGREIKSYIDEVKSLYKLTSNEHFIEKKKTFYKKYRRSIYASKEIKKGEKFSRENIKVVRPALGIEPKYYQSLIGKSSPNNIKFATPINKKVLRKILQKN